MARDGNRITIMESQKKKEVWWKLSCSTVEKISVVFNNWDFFCEYVHNNKTVYKLVFQLWTKITFLNYCTKIQFTVSGQELKTIFYYD